MELNPREKKMLQSPVDEAKYFYVWTLVRDVAHLLEKARDRELRPHGITVMQATVLHMIRMLGEEATPVALARVMFREAPTISSVLGRLEEQGLILKKRQGRRGGAMTHSSIYNRRPPRSLSPFATRTQSIASSEAWHGERRPVSNSRSEGPPHPARIRPGSRSRSAR